MEHTPQQTNDGMVVVRVLAAVLDRLVNSNAHLVSTNAAGPVTKFHALKTPGISILQYLERIQKYACCSTECFILALIYIDRLIQRNNFILTELNVHRVVITAILLAAKFFDDAYYNNAYYAKVGGVLISEMNGLEVEFLFRINFSLHVKPDVFMKYQAELVSHALGAGLEEPIVSKEGMEQIQAGGACGTSIAPMAPGSGPGPVSSSGIGTVSKATVLPPSPDTPVTSQSSVSPPMSITGQTCQNDGNVSMMGNTNPAIPGINSGANGAGTVPGAVPTTHVTVAPQQFHTQQPQLQLQQQPQLQQLQQQPSMGPQSIMVDVVSQDSIATTQSNPSCIDPTKFQHQRHITPSPSPNAGGHHDAVYQQQQQQQQQQGQNQLMTNDSTYYQVQQQQSQLPSQVAEPIPILQRHNTFPLENQLHTNPSQMSSCEQTVKSCSQIDYMSQNNNSISNNNNMNMHDSSTTTSPFDHHGNQSIHVNHTIYMKTNLNTNESYTQQQQLQQQTQMQLQQQQQQYQPTNLINNNNNSTMQMASPLGTTRKRSMSSACSQFGRGRQVYPTSTVNASSPQYIDTAGARSGGVGGLFYRS